MFREPVGGSIPAPQHRSEAEQTPDRIGVASTKLCKEQQEEKNGCRSETGGRCRLRAITLWFLPSNPP